MTDQPTARDGRPAQPPEASDDRGDGRIDDRDVERDHRVDPPPETGDTRVDDALAGLADIVGQPPAEHVAVYEEVHRRLQDTLADLDDDG